MKRKIKFRVWSVKEGLMSDPFTFRDIMSDELFGMSITPFIDIFTGVPVDEVEDDTKYILMQYTGLKDKNGKEIYEGDLIQLQDPYNMSWANGCAEVVFSNEYVGGWVVQNGKHNLNLGSRQNHLKIIGNIHQNPELLTK